MYNIVDFAEPMAAEGSTPVNATWSSYLVRDGQFDAVLELLNEKATALLGNGHLHFVVSAIGDEDTEEEDDPIIGFFAEMSLSEHGGETLQKAVAKVYGVSLEGDCFVYMLHPNLVRSSLSDGILDDDELQWQMVAISIINTIQNMADPLDRAKRGLAARMVVPSALPLNPEQRSSFQRFLIDDYLSDLLDEEVSIGDLVTEEDREDLELLESGLHTFVQAWNSKAISSPQIDFLSCNLQTLLYAAASIERQAQACAEGVAGDTTIARLH